MAQFHQATHSIAAVRSAAAGTTGTIRTAAFPLSQGRENFTGHGLDEVVSLGDFLAVRKDGGEKWGFVKADSTVTLVLDYEYDEFIKDRSTLIPVRKGDKWAIAEKWGMKFKSKFIYDEIIELDIREAVVVINGVEKKVKFN